MLDRVFANFNVCVATVIQRWFAWIEHLSLNVKMRLKNNLNQTNETMH